MPNCAVLRGFLSALHRHYALFVTGPPASGKSVVAEYLAEALPGFVRLEKDALKEALFEAGDAAAVGSRGLSDAAMELLWALVPKSPRAIVEANFRTSDARERERFAELKGEKLEVHCWCSAEIAMRRFAARAEGRHPAHSVKELSLRVYEESEAPFGSAPLIRLDTTGPVDLPRLLEEVRGYWPKLWGGV